jgi:hypothetical protein
MSPAQTTFYELESIKSNKIGLKRAYSESQAPEDSIRVLMEQSLEGLKKFPLLTEKIRACFHTHLDYFFRKRQ